MREIPTTVYKRDTERLMKYYSRSYTLVTKELIRLLEAGSWQTLVNQQASIVRQIQKILQDNDSDVEPIIEKIVRDSFKEGQARTLMDLGEAKTLSEATKGVSMSLMATQTIDAMVADTFEDVLSLTDRTSKRIKKQVRDIAGEVMRLSTIQQIGLDTMRKDLTTQLLKKGFSKTIEKNFKGVTDSAGRRWKLDAYVNMITKTKVSQAYMEGAKTEAVSRGVDLAVISSHGAKDACRKYEGMVVSLTGATKGFPTLQEIKQTNEIFHPNCSHTITPLRSMDLLPESQRKIAEEKIKNYESSK